MAEKTKTKKIKLTDEQKAMVKWIRSHPLASHADFGKAFFGDDADSDLVSKTIHTLVEARSNGKWSS